MRPTTDRVKESLFNILQFGIEGRRFLDLFAGSGQIGLEALSRGAGKLYLWMPPDSVKVLEKNVAATGFQDRSQIVPGDYAVFLAGNSKPFDIAFWILPTARGFCRRRCP